MENQLGEADKVWSGTVAARGGPALRCPSPDVVAELPVIGRLCEDFDAILKVLTRLRCSLMALELSYAPDTPEKHPFAHRCLMKGNIVYTVRSDWCNAVGAKHRLQ